MPISLFETLSALLLNGPSSLSGFFIICIFLYKTTFWSHSWVLKPVSESRYRNLRYTRSLHYSKFPYCNDIPFFKSYPPCHTRTISESKSPWARHPPSSAPRRDQNPWILLSFDTFHIQTPNEHLVVLISARKNRYHDVHPQIDLLSFLVISKKYLVFHLFPCCKALCSVLFG